MSATPDHDPLRDELTAGLLARLRRYEETGDRRPVLAAEAWAEARRLLALVKEALAETDVLYAVGMLHWQRARLLPENEGAQDLEIAVPLLRVVHMVRPDAVPADLAVHFQEADDGVDTRFRAEHRLGIEQLHRALATGDPAALAEAVLRFTEALRLVPAGHGDRAGILSDLGVALRNTYERTGDLDTLDSAIAHLREAVRTAASAAPARAMFLSNLGGALLNRYMASRSREDLTEGLDVCRQAVGLTRADDPEYAKRLSNLGGALLNQYQRDQEPAALDEGVDVLQRAVDASVPSDPLRQRYVFNLAGALANRGQRAGDMADMDRSIGALQSIVRDVPADHPLRFPALNNLCQDLRNRYLLTDSSHDLDACIDAGRAALGAITPSHPLHAVTEGALGRALCDRFNRARNSADLKAAIRLLRSAAHALPDSARKSDIRTPLGSALMAWSEISGDPADLEAAIQAMEEAAGGIPADHPAREEMASQLERARLRRQQYADDLRDASAWIDHWRRSEQTPVPDDPRDPEKPKVLNDLGLSLYGRFQITGDAAVLDEAVEKVRAAVRATSADAPRRAGRLANLAVLLRARHELTGGMTDLDAAVGAAQEAVDATPGRDPALVRHLSLLSDIRHLRQTRTQDLGDLGLHIDAARAAARAAAPDDPERPRYQANLAAALGMRHERTGAAADLDAAIEAGRAAGDDHTLALLNLGEALLSRYDSAGDPGDLNEAVHMSEKAVRSTVPGASHRANALAGRSRALRRLFEHTGNPDDLDDCLRVAREAVAATDPHDEGHPGVLSILANALSRRFELTGALADIDESVETTREAIRRAPAHHRDLPLFHSNLASALLGHYHARSGRTDVLDEAVTHARHAARTAGGYHHSLHRFWGSLGEALDARYRRAGDATDLDESVDAHRRALDATPPLRVERALALHKLGSALEQRFRLTAGLPDLDESLHCHREAAALAPDSAPVRGVVLLELGRALVLRHAVARDTSALQEARVALEDAARNPVLTPSARVVAAEELARCHAETGAWTRACAAYEYAIGLLPAVAPRYEERRTQENWLGRFASLASDAAACALRLDDPERALRLLEAGRGLLLAQALEIRTDVTGLRRAEPELADRLTALRLRLDGPGTEFPGGSAVPPGGLSRRAAEERRRAVAEFDALLDDIRRLPGFEGFLRPPTTAELCAQAVEGPVVVVNTSDFRCDALVLHHDRIQVVPLAGLTETAARTRAESFAQAVDASQDPARTVLERLTAQKSVHETLGWLWDVVAEPVLDALGLVSEPAPGRPWPRIWWSPGGLLSTLPLHAAGQHGEGAGPARTVMDRAVSSYTPTIRALAHSRARSGHGSGGVLAVSMPRTPGAAALDGALRELRQLTSHYPYALTLTGPEATASRVLAELPHHSLAHFACHAVNDPADPSAGRLLVHDHLERPLSIRDIARLNLTADLAYLSACETARTGPRFAAEAIHLTSAFQIAGYRHVIGTLWPVADDAAADIAVDVYDNLPQRPDGTPDTDHIALALHHALRRLRHAYRRVPTRWASHLHVGR
ncbi:CHAT domain-containing protein [Streptomyces sp. NPDC087849]|uniref:CHAT domain-containing protein n=1 Tax=Streptomyces sp. NPDC087849 TaxID=3365808 RepID=UPI003804DDF4